MTRLTGLTGDDHWQRTLLHLATIQLLAGSVFFIDLLLETQLTGMSVVDTLHVVTEFLAIVFLFLGFWLARRALTRLKIERDTNTLKLQSLRGEFDTILMRRFADWGLSEAQKDVALLTLRGLKIADIAATRGTAEGTIKAHMNAVFRAANVHTRGELTGLFMEEFLDFGAQAPRQA